MAAVAAAAVQESAQTRFERCFGRVPFRNLDCPGLQLPRRSVWHHEFMTTSKTGTQSTDSAGPRSIGRAFSSLRVYNYRIYWCGQLISMLGTWMQRLAQAWLVLKLTNSPLALGTVTTLQFLPLTLLSLYGGVIADRFPKRKLVMTTQSIATVQAIVLALLTTLGVIHLWEIYVLAAVLGTTNAFDMPARQAFPIELVGREEVANAVALNATLLNASRIIGPSLAGIAISTIGVAGCFWLNAVSFVAVLGALAAMRPAEFLESPQRQRGSARELLTRGVTYSVRTPAVLVLLVMLLFIGTFGFNFQVLLALLARLTLHASSLGYGLLYTGFGLGSLVAALFFAYSRAQSLRTVYIGAITFIASLALLGLSHQYLLTLGILTLVGAVSVIYTSSTQTRLQIIVPDQLRGRAMGVYTLLFNGTTPIGALFMGGVSEHWSVEVALEAAALLSVVGVVGAWLYQRRLSPEDLVRGTVQANSPLPVPVSSD